MSDFVQLTISNSQDDRICYEKRFSKQMSISDLKTNLEMITGACAGVMQVDLYRGDRLITPLRNDNAALGSYPIEDGMRIHVVGNTIFVSDHIDRFELTDKQCSDADGEAERQANFYDIEMKAVVRDKAVIEEERLASLVHIGDQCLVRVRGPRRVGTVMYKGPLDDRDGVFVGVKFEAPLGIHDGSLDGKQYFTCPPKCGIFVPVAFIEVGDFSSKTNEVIDKAVDAKQSKK